MEAIPSPAPITARPSSNSHRVFAIPKLIEPIPNKTDDIIRALDTECATGDLSKKMNHHLPNTKACRNYLANGNAADLGYLNYYKGNDYVLRILTCWKDPCQPNKVNRDMVEIDLRNF